jgi:hypothetical protein
LQRTCKRAALSWRENLIQYQTRLFSDPVINQAHECPANEAIEKSIDEAEKAAHKRYRISRIDRLRKGFKK